MEDIIMIVLVSVRDNEQDFIYNIGYVEDAEKEDFEVAKNAAENYLKVAVMSNEKFGEIHATKIAVRYLANTPSHSYTLILTPLSNLSVTSINS